MIEEQEGDGAHLLPLDAELVQQAAEVVQRSLALARRTGREEDEPRIAALAQADGQRINGRPLCALEGPPIMLVEFDDRLDFGDLKELIALGFGSLGQRHNDRAAVDQGDKQRHRRRGVVAVQADDFTTHDALLVKITLPEGDPLDQIAVRCRAVTPEEVGLRRPLCHSLNQPLRVMRHTSPPFGFGADSGQPRRQYHRLPPRRIVKL